MTKEPDDKQSVTVRLPTAMIERMDAWGVRHGVVKRSDVLRMLVTKALDVDDPRDRETLPADMLNDLEGMRIELGAATIRDAARKIIKMRGAFDQPIDDEPRAGDPEATATEIKPKSKPGIVERSMKALKSIAGDQPLSPSQRAAAKRG